MLVLHTQQHFYKKISIESFLFACCILWFSDQLICCLVFPADLGYIVTELLLVYAFICRVYYVYVVVVVIAPYSLICENSSHFNTTPRGVRWGPAAKFRQPSSPAEIYIICMQVVHILLCARVFTLALYGQLDIKCPLKIENILKTQLNNLYFFY